MNSILKHPALVHLPISVSILLPLFFIIHLWMERRQGRYLPDHWWYSFFLLATQVVSSILAYQSGLHDRVLSSASTGDLDLHADFALKYVAIGLILFLVMAAHQWLLVQGVKQKSLRLLGYLRILIFVILLIKIYFVYQVGHIGGSLV